MRYSPEHKLATHQRILDAAGAMFRRNGFVGASVEQVMRAAGLTVGGFYAHFSSKQSLLIEAISRMMTKRRALWFQGLEDLRGEAFLEHFIRRYLNRTHRDLVDDGCPVPALASEVSRSEPPVRKALAEEIDATIRQVAARLDGPGARQRAVAAVAVCMGALTLSRATEGHPLSDELLEAARRALIPAPSNGLSAKQKRAHPERAQTRPHQRMG